MPDSLAVTGRLMQEALPYMMFGGLFLGFIAVGIVALILRNKEKERMHKERILLLEKGETIPDALYGIKPEKEKALSDYRTTRIWLLSIGIFFVLIGVAMVISMSFTQDIMAGLEGLPAAGIGVALILIERVIFIMFVKRNGNNRRS